MNIDLIFVLLQHHCRKCGSVVCGACSSQKFLLPTQSSKPLRVCDPCYAILAKTQTAPDRVSDSAAVQQGKHTYFRKISKGGDQGGVKFKGICRGVYGP